MNEKQIEISLAKLRKLWKQNKTQIGKDRIMFIANQFKKLQSTPLIPLSHGNTEAVNQGNSDGIEYFTPDFVAALARTTGKRWFLESEFAFGK